MFFPRILLPILALHGLSALLPAHAASGEAEKSPALTSGEESPWTLGFAAGRGKFLNPFTASDDLDIYAVLDIAWYGSRFFFDNGDLGAVLRESSSFSVNALVTFNNERNYFGFLNSAGTGLRVLDAATEDSLVSGADITGNQDRDPDGTGGGASRDTPSDAGSFGGDIDSSLPERNFAVNAGLEFLHISQWGDIQAQVLTDVSGTHHGQAAWLSYTYPWFTPNSEFAFSAGVEWKSRDLVDYYYGVRRDEVIPGRPAYEGTSGTNAFLRFSASRRLSERWKAVGVMEREFLSSSIRNSPVIERDTSDTFFLGLYYRF